MATRAELAQQKTLRRDLWWLEAVPTVLLLGGFVVYATWAAFANDNYFVEPYLSPFYSPCLAANCIEGSLAFRLIGSWWTISPALLILIAPLGFRTTCYYYRKSYYRAFMGSPPACAVRDVNTRKYTGERQFPFVLQNLHRYFFWAVIPVLGFLWWDAIEAFRFEGGVGMGMGTVVLLLNAVFLSMYSMSCHSCRHIVGGTLDVFSKNKVRYKAWRFVSRLNERHGLIAWISMVWVAWADVYVRLVATDTVRDLRLF